MNAAKITHLESEANRVHTGTVQGVYCADIRALLTERQELLEALQGSLLALQYHYAHEGDKSALNAAEQAIQKATT